MAKKSEDDDAPDAASSLAALSRLAALWRSSDHVHGLTPVQWEALRFLQQANRFSNSPGALAKYLGATKGTISQSLTMLETKGLIAKTARAGDQRSVGMALTEKALALLAEDQRRFAETTVIAFRTKTQRRLALALEALLVAETSRLQLPLFGRCATCRFFREGGHDGSDTCMTFETSLDADEQAKTCVEHQAR